MTAYLAPLSDMKFALRELVDLDDLLGLYPEAGLTPDLVEAVLDQAARFAETVLAPLNPVGDRQGVVFNDGEVTTPPGFREAYQHMVASGWPALSCHTDFGGQGFPRTISALVEEMWRSANLTFSGCLTLTRSAIEVIARRASPPLQRAYLPAMVSGEWTGTMNLTEPQAGSDLSAIRTRAELAEDGTYRVFGEKIFISWGRHDMSANVVHLVLARTPDAPEGVKGLSMFLVPERLLDPAGDPGPANDVQCASIELKAGQHGAPAATMRYGAGAIDGLDAGAVGFLVGELHQGLETMFIMMNEARFGVGLEGHGASERAFQTARAYARERVQGSEIGGVPGVRVPIARHPDVRRMLMRMKAACEGMRAVAVVIAAALDRSERAPDPHAREEARAFVDLMTPVFKAWNTETANQLTSLGVQVHGGLGFMEECAAAQHWKDARILSIYEGTTAIQANDLVTRKIVRDGGRSAKRLASDIRSTSAEARDAGFGSIAAALAGAADAIERCVDFVLGTVSRSPREVLAVAVPILTIFGNAVVGWQLARGAIAAAERLAEPGADKSFLDSKLVTARFFAEHWLPEIDGLLGTVTRGGESVLALDEGQF